jgi:hypothetical protein
MSDIILLAKSQLRDSNNFDGQFYTEWAVKAIDKESERDNLVNKYGCHEIWGYSEPYISIRRRVDIIDNEYKYHDWDILDFGNGILETAKRIGDSTYYDNAISLNPIHIEIVNKSKKIYELQKELNDLEDMIIPHKFERLSKLASSYNYQYERELKSKKLYKKAMNNNAPKNIVDEIRDRIKLEYQKEYNTINNRIETIKEELKNL